MPIPNKKFVPASGPSPGATLPASSTMCAKSAWNRSLAVSSLRSAMHDQIQHTRNLMSSSAWVDLVTSTLFASSSKAVFHDASFLTMASCVS